MGKTRKKNMTNTPLRDTPSKLRHIRWQSYVIEFSQHLLNQELFRLRQMLQETYYQNMIVAETQLLVLSLFKQYEKNDSPYWLCLFNKHIVVQKDYAIEYINECAEYSFHQLTKDEQFPFKQINDYKKYLLSRYNFYLWQRECSGIINAEQIRQIYFSLFHSFESAQGKAKIYDGISNSEILKSWREIQCSLKQYVHEINAVPATTNKHKKIGFRINKKYLKYIIATMIIITVILLIYLSLLNNRYEHISGGRYFDKWTQERVFPH